MTEVSPQIGATPLGLRITEVADEKGIALVLAGELDLASAPELERSLRVAEQGLSGRLLIDLSALEFIDSVGLKILVGALHSAQRNGHGLVLRRGPQQIRRLFELTGIADRFTFED